MDALLWHEREGAYFDYDARLGKRRHALCAATVAPLFTGTASARQAQAVARTVRQRLLAPGGLATTEWASGQQWDRPNGWAPLQWMAVLGFARYRLGEIADEIRSRWVKTVGDVYRHQGKVVEKYALRETHGETPRGGHGGEYPLQDGFGWTNGVTRRWLHEIPAHDVRVGESKAHDAPHAGLLDAPPAAAAKAR
jgi:alpha,alpha-trehalase